MGKEGNRRGSDDRGMVLFCAPSNICAMESPCAYMPDPSVARDGDLLLPKSSPSTEDPLDLIRDSVSDALPVDELDVICFDPLAGSGLP